MGDRTARKALIDRLDEGGFEWEEIHALIDAVVADALTAERARVAVLEEALRAFIAEADDIQPTAIPIPTPGARRRLRIAIEDKARTALSVLPVDRVGVEPLDVLPVEDDGSPEWHPPLGPNDVTPCSCGRHQQ